ncbi:hypothetical protein PANA5342_3367 [Pantoea ananatis LMG 5342]|nr:hypothetical protein PANA5342_3367 [Pantoea ananatis LMG 5342]
MPVPLQQGEEKNITRQNKKKEFFILFISTLK